jgi:hypothetical protein
VIISVMSLSITCIFTESQVVNSYLLLPKAHDAQSLDSLQVTEEKYTTISEPRDF